MALNLFGVTASSVAARVHDLTIDATTSPASTTVGEMINEAASRVYREAMRQGFDVSALASSDTDPSAFYLCRRLVILDVLNEVLTAKDRGNPDTGRKYAELFGELLHTLQQQPQTFDPRETGTSTTMFPAQEGRGYDSALALTLVGKVVSGGI